MELQKRVRLRHWDPTKGELKISVERVITSHPGRRSCEDKDLSLWSRTQQENMDTSLLVMDRLTLDSDWFSWFRADLAAQTGRLCFQERLSLLPLISVALFPYPQEIFLGLNAN